ncbi:hypothetical protein Tsubulata_014980 [Turnera subulata]|uniref:Uncharacterized protein n=1 Tax=Turnera subulata TaxID=218843 RepID=A0A9Q0F4X3_9ROSI|nr:hypothetical protein Tsubulata_014980 [Turnera subulata]
MEETTRSVPQGQGEVVESTPVPKQPRRNIHTQDMINQHQHFLTKALAPLRCVEDHLARILDCFHVETPTERPSVLLLQQHNDENHYESNWRAEQALDEMMNRVIRLAIDAENKANEYAHNNNKEKRELENSVASLTEENRDVNTLLRVALAEKEAVEKSCSKLKENTTTTTTADHLRRVPLLQIAERGLHIVGFGFMMPSGTTTTTTTTTDHHVSVEEEEVHTSASASSITSTPSSSNSDHIIDEPAQEVATLASTVERIMKNLRLEISHLRTSLEDSRSDTERLQSLAMKQAQDIADNNLYIQELEARNTVLTEKVEQLQMEIQETEAELARWRRACELEVEAGKNEIQERDQLLKHCKSLLFGQIVILRRELEKTKSALDTSNGKLKLKEELAAAAIAAQEAAERSIQASDRKARVLHERIEELMKQLEEVESRERSHLKLRHICWPWRGPKVNPTNVRRLLPEMQSFFHSIA